mmetsp:Transcript_1497/g.4062  ORF Transcript_1497/g.4062 Transcript_1497/m.4062 type:complete len:323 (-) Transcript_1497:78-1046(-)
MWPVSYTNTHTCLSVCTHTCTAPTPWITSQSPPARQWAVRGTRASPSDVLRALFIVAKGHHHLRQLHPTQPRVAPRLPQPHHNPPGCAGLVTSEVLRVSNIHVTAPKPTHTLDSSCGREVFALPHAARGLPLEAAESLLDVSRPAVYFPCSEVGEQESEVAEAQLRHEPHPHQVNTAHKRQQLTTPLCRFEPGCVCVHDDVCVVEPHGGVGEYDAQPAEEDEGEEHPLVAHTNRVVHPRTKVVETPDGSADLLAVVHAGRLDALGNQHDAFELPREYVVEVFAPPLGDQPLPTLGRHTRHQPTHTTLDVPYLLLLVSTELVE